MLSSTISTLIGGIATSSGLACVVADPRFAESFLPDDRIGRGDGGRGGCCAGGVVSAEVVGGENGVHCWDCGGDCSGREGGCAGAAVRAVEAAFDAGMMGSVKQDFESAPGVFFFFCFFKFFA